MSDLDLLVGQMSTDIQDLALQLDDVRLGLFLNWLAAHNRKIKTNAGMLREAGGEFKPVVHAWLASLSVQGMLWEYRLIMDEIVWWQELAPHRLDKILKPEDGQ